MAAIAIYSPNDVTVADRVIKYLPKAHTPDYDSETNKLVNPDLAGVVGVDQRYWKVDTGAIVEMSPAEKSAINALSETSKTGVHNLLTFSSKVKKSSWTRVESFVYEGEYKIGAPYEIQAICYVDSGVTADLRLFDKTNGAVLGTLSFSNTDEDKLTVNIINDWPNDAAIVEVQVKRTTGTGKKKVHVNGMLIGY